MSPTTEEERPMLTGSCLCGAIAYEAAAFVSPIGHCHCRTCRKAHSAAFSTTARVARDGFRWIRGADRLRHYESSPGKLRHFCSLCGSQLMAEWVRSPTVILRLGCLDSEIEERPIVHVWTSQKAPWFEIGDELPQLPAGVAAVKAK
jgi:hypothetical protein